MQGSGVAYRTGFWIVPTKRCVVRAWDPTGWKDSAGGLVHMWHFVVTVVQGEVCDLWDDVSSDSFLGCPRGGGGGVNGWSLEDPPRSRQQLPDVVVSVVRTGKVATC